VADPFQNGLDAYNIGDYATAHRLWRPLAEQGNVAVQHSLGLMYANGQGVTKNYVEAAKWWRLAAEQGDAPAQFNLGVMYRDGLGVPQDYVRTHMWFDLLASRSPVVPQNLVGGRNRGVSAYCRLPFAACKRSS